MSAGRYDIDIEQGSTFALSVTYQDTDNNAIDLSSGYTAAMQVRESFDSTSSLLSLSSPGEITLNQTGPNIEILVGPATTAALDFDHAVYDLELVQAASTDKILRGNVKLVREVTK